MPVHIPIYPCRPDHIPDSPLLGINIALRLQCLKPTNPICHSLYCYRDVNNAWADDDGELERCCPLRLIPASPSRAASYS